MNKQALAFLTMFSLVLMLSVYYVTLPADSTMVMKEDGSKPNANGEDAKKKEEEKKKEESTETKKQQENTSKEDKVSALQESINKKIDIQINKNSAVVGDEKSDETSKKKALATIDTLKEQKSMQQKIVDALAKDKYKSAVELKDGTCIVNVFEQKDDKEIARKIMNKTNELTNSKYLIEVSFK